MAAKTTDKHIDSAERIFRRNAGILKTGEAFTAGVEEHTIENTKIRVYCAEKTLADCFKYRNKIGMDTVLEALTLYRANRKPKPRKLLQFAKVCRVENVMRPYLEALL